MHLPIHVGVAQPFSLAQSIAFLRGFCPVARDYAITHTSVTAAAYGSWFTLRAARDNELVIDLPDGAPARIARLAAAFVGAHEDPRPFYAAAAGDAPMEALIARLHGLHHVRFLTLEEIAVYCVLMQRNPIARAAALKAKFLAAFGDVVATPAGTLRGFPAFPALLALTAGEIGRAIGHPAKGVALVDVVRGVADLGEDFLTTAPYAEARDALLAIRGIGPFSAGAILLRGLGRMDELPTAAIVEDAALEVYGRRFDPDATLARYGRLIGWWSYYLKTGAGQERRRVRQNVSASANSFS